MKQLLFFIFIPGLIWAQPNLVPNPSFENQSNCAPQIAGNLGGGVLLDWYNPNIATPDYFNNCWMIPPPQNFHYQIADGDGFVGIAIYDPNGSNGREYVACQLLDTLQSGKLYRVSFYARIFYGHARFASNNLGIHFSDTALHSSNGKVFNYFTPPRLEAQVKYFNNEVISDSAHWSLISGLYQAQGSETWLTIGNFNLDSETTQGVEYTDGIVWQTYFVVDMVSVIPLDSIPEGIPAKAGADTTIFINDTAFIGQKISNMPSNWHLLDGTPIATNTAGLYVSPQVTTTYVVSHTLNGLFSADTVTVTVIDNLGLEELNQKIFTLYPVPNKGTFTIQGELYQGDHIGVFNLDGKEVYSQQINVDGNLLEVQTPLLSGVYFIRVTDETSKLKYHNKIVITN